ncbi:hypothetical protein Vafri_21302, partial [Volvox africanus]
GAALRRPPPPTAAAACGDADGKILSAAVIGVGFAAAVAYEVAVQLQTPPPPPAGSSGGGGLSATVLLLLEDPRLRRCCEVASQPWFQLRDWVAGWRPDLDLTEFAMVGRLLEEQGHSAQMDYVGGLAPPGVSRAEWDLLAEEQARSANGRVGYGWEEMQYSWTVLYGMVEALHDKHCPRRDGGGHASAAITTTTTTAYSGGGGSGGGGSSSSTVGASGAAAVAEFSALPAWEAFLLDLYALMERPEAQLEYLVRYRPAAFIDEMSWDTTVRDLLWTASYLKSIAHTHKPEAPFLGETVFLHAAPPIASVISGSVRDFNAGWAAGATRSFALLVQPVRMVRLHDASVPAVAEALDDSSMESSAPPTGSPILALTTLQLQQLLSEAVNCYSRVAAIRRQLAVTMTTSGKPLLPLVPCSLSTGGTEGPGGGGGGAVQVLPSDIGPAHVGAIASSTLSYVLVGSGTSAKDVSADGGTVGESAPLTLPTAPSMTLAALNRLCPMGQIIRAGGVAGDHQPEQSADSSRAAVLRMPPAGGVASGPMQTSQPVWFIHDETGCTTGIVRGLAELLQLPVYGINMPDFALPSAAASKSPSAVPAPPLLTPPTLTRLAEVYGAAVLAVQPHGPFCLAATSPYGCMLAFAVAAALEQQDHAVMLVLLDGPPCPPATALVDPVYCSLYETLLQQAIYDRSSAATDADASAIGAAVPPLPDLATFVATLQSRGAVPEDAGSLLSASASFRPPSVAPEAWGAVVHSAVHRAGLMRVLASSHRPTASFQGPAAVVLPEDRYGAAFLAASRQCCDGTVTALTLECRHGTALASDEGRRAAAAAVMEAVCEMLQML